MMPAVERHDFRGSEYRRNLLSHTVLLEPESLIANILGEHVWVNSLHHQTVDRPGHGLQVVGTTPGGVIEGVELKDHPFAVGVQWHPEELVSDENMLRLFETFVQACNGKALRVLNTMAESNGR